MPRLLLGVSVFVGTLMLFDVAIVFVSYCSHHYVKLTFLIH